MPVKTDQWNYSSVNIPTSGLLTTVLSPRDQLFGTRTTTLCELVKRPHGAMLGISINESLSGGGGGGGGAR